MAGPSLSSIHGVHQSNLPLEVMERVLSLLPLPVLCRMRTVCKEWNHIICSSSFHDSYEQTWEERGHGACFLTKFHSNPYTKIDRSVRGTTCFLDLDERRWYLIKGSVDQGFDTRDVAMGDGLVAEICCPIVDDEGYNIRAPTVCCIQMSDPILKMRWRLDPCPNESKLPSLVVVAAHRGSRVFRIFAFDNSGYPFPGFHRCLWIYESSTNKWRCARKGSDNNYARAARSAVVFQQGLYAIFRRSRPMGPLLALYDVEKDTWSMVLENLPASGCVQLVVSSSKLFMMILRSARSSSSSSAMMLEMVEIQVSEKTSRIVFQIPASTLSHIFGEVLSQCYTFAKYITCLALRLNSDSSCSSVVLFSKSSGKVIIYNVVSATADILPEHPLGETKPGYHQYWATHQNLYVRDILQKDAQSNPPVYVPKEQLI
ncbi:hypothetical protein KC19_2G142000 [Ceratodon purpureus]|uniref:F-box domain-containing protein n=1 Tax=Ceratodon purpureus TaxID=3225 RepID=A0A8T0IVH0_CERPU|nr:hypothetical protein KC19_2G142000 [Ceratodon purpureus]